MGTKLQITTVAFTSGERAFLQNQSVVLGVSVNQLVRNAVAGLRVSGQVAMPITVLGQSGVLLCSGMVMVPVNPQQGA